MKINDHKMTQKNNNSTKLPISTGIEFI